MKRPQFEHFRRSLAAKAKPLPQQAREPYRAAIVLLLEETGEILVQKARKDGHDEAMIEIHGSWVGTDFSTGAVISRLRAHWPGSLFAEGEAMHWIEAEEEVVTLSFAASLGAGALTGRVKITV